MSCLLTVYFSLSISMTAGTLARDGFVALLYVVQSRTQMGNRLFPLPLYVH